MSLELDATHTLLCRQARIQRKLDAEWFMVKALYKTVYAPFHVDRARRVRQQTS